MKIEYRIILMILVLSQVAYHAEAQKKFGNEWINPSKNYLKLKVAENGIYKLTYEEMVAAGFIDTKINGSDLQLINYGTDQAIYVSDNDFGPGDHIEFYGEKNTIGLDSLLYSDWQKDLLNPDYSLVNDTNAYFLAISPEKNNIRYTLKNPNFGSTNLTPFPYYLHEEKLVFSKNYYKNAENKIRNTIFESSEGFCNDVSQSSSISLKSSHLVFSGPDPTLSIRMGLNSNYSKLEILWNGTVKQTKTSEGKKTLQFNINLSKSELNADNTLKINNIQSTEDRHFLSNAGIVYPREFDFGGKSNYTFAMAAMTSQRLLEINNFNNAGDAAVLYDPTNKIRYSTKQSGNKLQAIIDGSTKPTSYYLANVTDGIKVVPSITNFKPQKFENDGQQYVIISNKLLYNFGPDYVAEYANYRSSTKGGNYNTEIVEIQDIYDHFGYGIDRHFQGIKQFSSYMKEKWVDVKFVFIIGKAVEYPYLRTNNDVINHENKAFFIPTYGYSGSDNMLFSEGNYHDPYFAIGRLAATTPDDIKNYLDKIKLFDLALELPQTVSDKYWMKKIMHLGGGTTFFEQSSIKSTLTSLKETIENNEFGGNVFSFFKTSSDPIQISTSDQLLNLINSGVSMITFFGHSGTGTFDFAIENPNKFTNYGKFHIVNSLGCYSGNIHTTGSSISESFILEKDKGAIAFIASSGTAFINDLANYSKKFYSHLGEKDKNYSFGEIVQLINKYYRFDTLEGPTTLYQQLTFHGDPAVKLYKDGLPDYTFDESSVKINEDIITTNTQNIEFTGDIVNLGANIHQNVFVKTELILPDGTIHQIRYDTIYATQSKFPFSFSLSLAGERSSGINKIKSTIDFENTINEGPKPAADENNELQINGTIGFDFFVSNNDVRPVFPDNFSIYSKSDLQLIAVNSDLFAKANTYYFEIDTTATFDGPFTLKTQIIQNTGGAISWKPNISLEPKTVYYWRIAPKPAGNEGFQWRKSSFIYLPTSPAGWNQSHYYQHLENQYTNINLDSSTRKLQFVKNLSSAIIINGLFPTIHPEIKVNADPFRYIRYDAPVLGGIYVSVFDPITGEYWKNQFPSLYGSTMNSPWAAGWGIFPYHTNRPEQRKLLMDFLENIIPDGHIVTMFSIQRNDLSPKVNYDPEKWYDDSAIYGTTLFKILEKQGIKNLESTVNTRLPFILAYKKNDPNFKVTEEYAQNETEELRSVINIETYWTEGKIITENIGPAKKWNKLVWNEANLVANEDKTGVNIYGVRSNGNVDTLKIGLKGYDIDISDISANKYPYLQLEYTSQDKVSRTSAHLPLWRVLYDGFPEIVMDASTEFEFYKDTLNQGENMIAKFGLLNASDVATESFEIEYKINQPNNNFKIKVDTISSIAACQSKQLNYKYNTEPFYGDHAILINANKEISNFEKNKGNNISTKKFYVQKDKNAPILDVTFDGVHILDEDIVSPKPQIEILVTDETSFLALNDLNLVELKLYTDRNVEIPIQQNELSLVGVQSSNVMKILFLPTLSDGDYRLDVQAKDKSGNKSGATPYSIKFKVITSKSVTQVLNYPNPFSTSTEFIFTLTGQEVPENINIIIYTLSGKIVKEITKDQLGPLRIGTNRSTYKWDGTDEFGSKLANGVYVYKVNVSDKMGKKYEILDTKANSLFKEGFGKLVILR